jgi:hypothetical protein
VQAIPEDDDERGVRRTSARLRSVQESSRLFEQNVKNSTISSRESELTVIVSKAADIGFGFLDGTGSLTSTGPLSGTAHAQGRTDTG